VPVVLTVLVLMAVVPVTDSVVTPVTVSAAASPKAALPEMARLWTLPATAPRNVTVEPVTVALAPSVTASL
jgi:hypothetical protein